LGASLAQW